MTAGPRVFRGVPLAGGAASVGRADVEVSGLDQAGPSYELRVFIDAPEADAQTPPTPEHGYADSIWIYGYGAPAAEPGAGPRHAMTRSIIATRAVRRALAGGPTATVTLVPVSFEGGPAPIDLDAVGVTVLVD